ncbi:MAG: histidine kinase N-terminal 7TM domain-containing protein [Caldilinea sp.]
MFVIEHLPFALFSVAAAVICMSLARYAWRRRTVAGATEFTLLMAAVAWASLVSAIEYMISAHALPAKLFASKLYVLGGSSAALLVFLFALRYAHRDRWLTRRWLILLWSVVVVEFLLALSNDWHRLYWASIDVSTDAPTASVVFTHAPLQSLISVYSYGLLLAGAAIIIFNARRAPTIYRRQGMIMSLAVLIPILTNVIYYVGAGPWQNFDFTPLSFGISGVLMAWAIFGFQFLDLAPIAQDALFANLGDGVVVVNARQMIVAVNPTAQQLLAAGEATLIGMLASALPAPWGATFSTALGAAGKEELQSGGKSLAITSSILTTRGQPIGHILMLHDVTAYRVLQDRLVQLNSALEVRVAARTAELEQTVAHLRSEIEERQRVESKLRHMQESLADHIAGLSSHLSALYEIILLGGKSLDLEAVRRLTLETIKDALHADAGFLLNYLPAMQRFELAVQHGLTDVQIERLVQQDTRWLLSDPIPRTILQLPGVADIPDAIRVAGMSACVLTSIFHMGTPVGVLGVYWREPPSLSVEEIALFRALGDQLAVLTENVRLREVHDQALVQEERQRIARDLHDSVTQSLYALTLGADTVADRLQRGRIDGVEPLVGKIGVAAHQALREIRLLLYELRLATPDAMSLAEALQVRLEAVEQRAGIDAHLQIEKGLDFPAASAHHLYWIAIEALNNSLKHAAAQHVIVSLHADGDGFELSVADDGVGLMPHPGASHGLGLRSMTERAAQIGGALHVRTLPSGGAEISVRVPGAGYTHRAAVAGDAPAVEVRS